MARRLNTGLCDSRQSALELTLYPLLKYSSRIGAKLLRPGRGDHELRTVKPTTLSCIAGLLVVITTPVSAALSAEHNPSPTQNQSTLEPPPPPPAPPRPVPPPPISVRPPTPSTEPALPVSQARGASPRNERRWTQRILNAYPSRAKREGIEGTVGVRVAVTPQGRGTNCQVTSSSGSKLLDEAACKGMERFARFNPARDQAGNPASGIFSKRITYGLSPADKEWAEEEAKIEAELAKHRGGSKEYDEALAWLDASKLFVRAISSGDGSAVFVRGFIDARQITPERLSALNEGSIKPNLLLTKPDEVTREPIQIVHSQLQSGVPDHCVMLMQVHRRDGAQDLGDLLSNVIDGAPFRAPSFALDDECNPNTPWDEGIKPGDPFEWNGAISFTAEGGYVRIDENISCDGLDDITSGHFTLSTFATVQTEFLTNLPIDPDRVGQLNYLNAKPFGQVSRFFTRGVERAESSDVREMSFVFDPAVVGDTNDILARYSVLDDDDKDEFCIVTRLEQNASVFQRVMRMPRDGKRLDWDPARTRGSLSNPPEIREFAEAIGAEFHEIASVTPTS